MNVPNPDILVSVCAYCCKPLGTKPNIEGRGIQVSHGVCHRCAKRFLAGDERVWTSELDNPEEEAA